MSYPVHVCKPFAGAGIVSHQLAHPDHVAHKLQVDSLDQSLDFRLELVRKADLRSLLLVRYNSRGGAGEPFR